ncbi:MauE/DoxX family redox-associated membrane protein [Alteromonas ponticola]|uniref:Methylamine utilization protein MauE n=1 Tax=Alteromonas ponticola TaxID=2720613 RepID=A0ABX1R3V5_9ALTE|nr:glutaredoxin [Alteromonas ponticola]NMH59890.1 glutaredoxin [Alteromonas ponticola]
MSREATLYRMVTDQHICPYGLKSKDLLERKGFAVEDHKLTSREETDAFKEKHGVETTPQTFIDGKRVGGYDDLREFFGKAEESQKGSRYTPVIAIFAIAALFVIALLFSSRLPLAPEPVILHFVAFAMVLLALQKLQDVRSFATMFITYDLLAMKHLRYAYFYPFAEAYAGIGMLAQLPVLAVAPVSIFIGGIGAASVIKAVYIDKRELKCACVGGDSDVPLGFISLSENLFMLGAGLWMLSKLI